MANADKIKMRIQVADEVIPLTVGFDEQDDVRDTESRIHALYADWHRRFPHKSTKELLAMMTYQYASYYLAYSRRYEDVTRMLEEFEGKIDDMINNPD